MWGGEEGLYATADFKLFVDKIDSKYEQSIYQWLYSPLLGLGRFFSFLIFSHSL
jgi:hypothetical protein